MLNAKNSIKDLISGIYECQKRIIINNRFIRELNSDGNDNDSSRLRYEIKCLLERIIDLKKELCERYQYTY